jgi:glucan biosynthesis protein C
VGPSWYTALLLVFEILYTIAASKHFASSKKTPRREPHPLKGQPASSTSTPEHRYLDAFYVIIGLSLAAISSFLVRIRSPFVHIFVSLALNLGYLPQYILYYCAGVWIQRHGIPRYRVTCSRALFAASVITFNMVVFGAFKVSEVVAKGGSLSGVTEWAGGESTTFAFLYSTLNEFVGFLLSTLLLYIFHQSSVLSSRWKIFGVDVASGSSYATFLMHIPVLVEAITFINKEAWIDRSLVLKTTVIGGLVILKSWTLGLGLKWTVEWCGWRGYI